MKFDNIENFSRYAHDTICLIRNVGEDNFRVGYVSSRVQNVPPPEPPQINDGIDDVDIRRELELARLRLRRDEPDPGRVNLIYFPDNKDPITIKRAKDWEVKSPINGYIQCGDSAVYLTREAKRMWRVGFCKTNTSPNWLWDNHTVLNITDMVSRLHNKTCFARSIDEALMMVGNSKKRTRVLSSRYAVSKEHLLYRDVPVADIIPKDKVVMFQNRRHADFHRGNLSEKAGAFDFQYMPERTIVSMKDYKYDYDI